MAQRFSIKIATVNEVDDPINEIYEDCLETVNFEEDRSSFYSLDGESDVEDVDDSNNYNHKGENEEEIKERRSSVVEKELPAEDEQKPPPFLLKPPKEAGRKVSFNYVPFSPTSPSSASRIPKLTSPGVKVSAFVFPVPEIDEKLSSSNNTLHLLPKQYLKSGKFPTIIMRDKFVTELSMFNPFHFEKRHLINTGIFIATSKMFSEHSIYKISPISFLSPFKMQPKDKIKSLNGLNIREWSHDSILSYFRSLGFQFKTQNSDQTTIVYTQTLSIEYISQKNLLESSSSSITSRLITATLYLSTEGRMTVTDNSIMTVQIQFIGNSQKLLKVEGTSASYLKVTDASQGTPATVAIGQRTARRDPSICFTIHEFQRNSADSNLSGRYAVIEAGGEGIFLQANSSENGGPLSLQVSNATVSEIQTIDNRLFQIVREENLYDNTRIAFLNVQTGLYLSRNGSEAVLKNEKDTTFTLFDCTL